MSLYDLASDVIRDHHDARNAAPLLEDLADQVVEEGASALEADRASAEALAAPAAEPATTVGTENVLALGADLDATKLGDALPAARPPETIWPGEQAPQVLDRDLVAALAPALLAVLRERPRYGPGRDAPLLSRLPELSKCAGDIPEAARDAAAQGAANRRILEERERREQA